MVKCACKWLKLFVTHAKAASYPAPVVHGVSDFTQYFLGSCRLDSKIRDHGHKGVDGHLGACILGDPCLQFAHALRRRVDVEGRRQPPELTVFMQEAVIAQMVVSIRNQNREGDTPPQLFNVSLYFSPVYADCIQD